MCTHACCQPHGKLFGSGWTTVLLTGLTYLSMVFLLLLKIFGPRLRKAAGFEQDSEKKQELEFGATTIH